MKYLQSFKSLHQSSNVYETRKNNEKYFLTARWKYFPYMRWEYFFTVLPDRQTDNIIRELMFMS